MPKLAPLSLILSACLLLGGEALAQTKGGSRVTEPDVVREAMAHNPGLQAALSDYQQAVEQLSVEQHRYLPSLQLDSGATHSETPRLSGDEGTTLATSDSITLGSELRYTMPWGTYLSARLEGSRTSSSSQAYTGTDQLITQGPGYGLTGRLTVSQPLLRGFGTAVGEAELRQAELSRTASEHARDRAGSETLRDALVAFWELWYTERALGIDRAAAQLAQRQHAEAARKDELGSLAKVNVLTFETRVAELDQAVLGSISQWQQQSLRLGLLLGRDAATSDELHAVADGPPPAPERDRKEVLKAAVDESYVVAQRRAELEQQRDRATIAGEADRPRLDVEAYLQADGLGNKEIPPALEQYATFGAVSAHVGLVFEVPLCGGKRRAERRAAEASVMASRARLQAAEQQAESEAAAELVKLEQARRRVALADKTAAVAERNLDAQRKRYQQGDAIALEVHEAEDQLRRARLTVQRARVDLTQAQIRLEHLTGELLRRYGKLVPPRPRGPAGALSLPLGPGLF